MADRRGIENQPQCNEGANGQRDMPDRYRSFFQMCPVGIIISTPSGKVVEASEFALSLFGYGVEEMIGMNLREISVESTDWKRFRKKLEEKGYLRAYEIKFRRKDGGQIDCLVTANIHRDSGANGKEYQCAVWDFSDYRSTLESLQRSERLYRLLAENVTDGLWTSEWDSEMNLHTTFLSESIKNVLGYTSEETQPRTIQKLMVPSSAESGYRAFLEQIAMEQSGEAKDPSRSWTVEMEMYHKNGGTVWAEARATFLRDSDGRPIGVMGVTRDITERKRTENTLRALSSRLVEVQEEERRHIARELHDQIGQALTSLKFSLEMIATQPFQDVKSRVGEALASINEIMDRVRNLSLELRPPMLDDLGLMPTLMRHFERYKAQTRVSVDFRQKGLQRRFAPELETAVFRIVQE